MKNQYFLSLIFCSLFSVSFGQQWWAQTTGTENDFQTIFAVDQFSVSAFGDSLDGLGGFVYGSHYKTINQGYTWNFTDMQSSVYAVKGCEFISPGIGITVGDNELSGNGFVRTTTDGGFNWVDQNPFSEKLHEVTYADAQTIYACGNNDFFIKSVNGGTVWSNLNTSTADDLFDLDFSTTSNGYVVGAGGVMAHTVDAALTWTNLTSGTGEDLFGVWFINDSTGWTVGSAGVILYTEDYGNSWAAQTSGTMEDLTDVEFVNDTTGWIVGTAGTVLKTTDAGTTWTAETSGTGQDLFAVTMIDETLGWFAGDNGVIHVYAVMPPNSINENQLIDLNVFPNPAQNQITIQLDDQTNMDRIILKDLSGRTVKSINSITNQMIIDISDLNAGTYIVEMSTPSGEYGISRLIKQ